MQFSINIQETFRQLYYTNWASLVAQLVKNLPAMKETLAGFLSWENPPEKGQVTHFSILGFPWWFRW